MAHNTNEWQNELKRILSEIFPVPPNFLYRPHFPKMAGRARIALHNVIDKKEIFWYKTIVAYGEFLKGYYKLCIDELEGLLKITPEEKKERRKLLFLNLALVYFSDAFEAKGKGDFELYKYMANKAEEYLGALLKITKDDQDFLRADALILSGFFLMWKEKYAESMHSFASTLKLAGSKELDYLDGVAKCYDGIGELYRINGKFNEANRYFAKALEIYERFGKARNIVEIQHNLALTQWNETKQNIDKIINKLYAHMNQQLELRDYKVALAVCRNIVSIYTEAGKQKEGREFIKKASEICNKFSLK